MIKIMVVGASGVLGKLVCMEMLRIFENQIKLIVTDYKTERGKKLVNSFNNDTEFQFLDVNEEENVKKVIKNVDIVVVVLKQRIPYIQKACIEKKIVCIDVTPFYDFASKVMELNQSAVKNRTGSVIMSGFFPGLSGLMIKKAIADFQEVTEVNVALLQNTNANAGVSGIIDMLKIISKPVMFQNNMLSGFTKKRKMYFLNHLKEKEVRLIDHSEKKLVKDHLTTARINYWTSWNDPTFNKLVSLVRQIGLIRIIHKVNHQFLSNAVKHNPNKKEDAFITVEVRGKVHKKERIRRVSLSTFSDYHTTAMVTASLAKIILKRRVNGVVYPFEVTNLDELLSVMNCSIVLVEDILD